MSLARVSPGARSNFTKLKAKARKKPANKTEAQPTQIHNHSNGTTEIFPRTDPIKRLSTYVHVHWASSSCYTEQVMFVLCDFSSYRKSNKIALCVGALGETQPQRALAATADSPSPPQAPPSAAPCPRLHKCSRRGLQHPCSLCQCDTHAPRAPGVLSAHYEIIQLCLFACSAQGCFVLGQ